MRQAFGALIIFTLLVVGSVASAQDAAFESIDEESMAFLAREG